MPYENEWVGKGVIFHYSDVVTGSEIIQSNREVIEDERFATMEYQIVDMLNANKFECTPDEIKRIARLDIAAAKKKPDVIVVIVTDQDLIFGFARMYEQYVGDESTWQTEIFDNKDDANARLKELSLI